MGRRAANVKKVGHCLGCLFFVVEVDFGYSFFYWVGNFAAVFLYAPFAKVINVFYLDFV
jgi:hypothetical protein